jgi:hypothetical protein
MATAHHLERLSNRMRGIESDVLARPDRLVTLGLFLAGACLGAALFLRAPAGAKPSVQDEFAYLLQAKMLATGHLSYPSPPLPEFFEAAHVLVVPRYAAKYFPGHAAVLAPFVALGVPWLAPSLLLGVTLAALFLAARLAQLPRWSALVACALVLGCSEAMATFGSYLSQTTSVAMVACAIVLAAAVRARPTVARVGWLFGVGAAAVLVRPFVGVALVGASIVLLVLLRPQPRLRFVCAAVVPLAVAGALALGACRVTTGSWTVPPWLLYARQYMPFDGPGIGPLREDSPTRALPEHLAPLAESFRASRAAYTVSRLPTEAQRRAGLVEDLAPGLLAIPFVLVGVAWTPLLFASIFALLYFGLQLTFHVAMPLYYLEMCPWLALSAAAGAVLTAKGIGRIPRRRWAVALAAPVLLAGVAVGAQASNNLSWEVTRARLVDAPFVRYDRIFSQLRRERAIVFLRYPREWPANADLGYNEPDLMHAELIRARDLGARNAELLRAIPGRPAYVLDVQSLAVSRLR